MYRGGYCLTRQYPRNTVLIYNPSPQKRLRGMEGRKTTHKSIRKKLTNTRQHVCDVGISCKVSIVWWHLKWQKTVDQGNLCFLTSNRRKNGTGGRELDMGGSEIFQAFHRPMRTSLANYRGNTFGKCEPLKIQIRISNRNKLILEALHAIEAKIRMIQIP